MRRGLVPCVLLLGGCDLVFELRDPPTTAPFEKCGVQTFDPLRYVKSPEQNDWFNIRIVCQRAGLDHVVFDTQEELDDIKLEGAPPYWIGVSGVSNNAIDDCDPLVDLVAAPASPDGCFVMRPGDLKMDRIGCNENTYPAGSQPITGLCEVRRPTAECAALRRPTYEVRASDLTRDDANDLCTLPEITSPEDLAALEEFMLASSLPEVWLAVRRTGDTWSASSMACPTIFRWGAGQPVFSSNEGCATHSRAEGSTARVCSQHHSTVICETR